MGTSQAQELQQAHALLDVLPQEKLTAVRSLLEVMVEPLAGSLASALMEDEEITPDGFASGAPADYFTDGTSRQLINHARTILEFCRSQIH